MKGNLAQPGPPATGLQMSSCCYGQPPQLIYGYDRVAPKCVFQQNFNSDGGGSGLFGSGGSSTTYSVNVDMLVGFNPCEGVADLWYNGSWFYIYSTTNVFNYSSASAGQTITGTVSTTLPNPITMIAGIYLANVPYSETYDDYMGPGQTNNFTLAGNGIIPLYNAAYAAPNNGSWSSLGMPYAEYNNPYGSIDWSVTFPYAITTPFSICVVFFYDVNDNYPNPLPSAQLAWESELGNGGTGAFSGAGNPLIYPEFAGVCGADINLGGSPTLPQWDLHVKGMFGIGFPVSQGSVSTNNGLQAPELQQCAGDCNPADVIFDIISSGNNLAAFGAEAVWNHGCGFSNVVYDPSGGQDNQFQYSRYGGLAIDEDGPIAFLNMRNYCLAYSILVSASITSQRTASDIIKELAEIANCAPCFNGASLDFVPYCEVSNFGNGANFIAPTSSGPLFNLTRANFLTTKKDKSGNANPKPPAVIMGGSPEDNYNSLAISIKDRTGTTNNNTLLLTDAYDVTRQGPLPQGSRSWPWIQNPSMAVNAGWAALRRNILVERAGKLTTSLPGQWSPILTLMDFLTAYESPISPDPIPVRITKISENETDMSLEIEVEKFIYGASEPVAPGTGIAGISGGGGPNPSGVDDPGSVNAPIILEATPALVAIGGGTQPEIWIGVSGGEPIPYGIIGATKINGGNNYNAATVSVTGSGTGAYLEAVIENGQVTNIYVVNPGENYTGTVTLVIVDPTGSGSGASYTAIVQAAVPVSYAGCIVNISTNGGTSYDPINAVGTTSPTVNGNQATGLVYSSNYPSHADPDNTDTLNVDMTESQVELNAFTTAQQQAFLSLCYLAGGGSVPGPNGTTLTIPYELIAYAAETLSAANMYALGPPIRRGVYSTPIAAHNIGTPFSFLLDGNIFKIPLSSTLIGTTIYFKFQAFNKNGTITQELSDCTAYAFTPTGLVGFSQQTYTILPTPTCYQGQAGGWPGVDGSSTGWTNTADVYFPATTATFSNGKVLSYAARDSGITPTSTPTVGQQVWVTIYDPSQVGEPNGIATLPVSADTNQTKWNSPGYIRIGVLTWQASGGSGGGGGSTSTAFIYSISAFEGDSITSPGSGAVPVGNQVLLTHQLPGPSELTSVALPLGLVGSVAGCLSAPTGSVVITIYRTPLGGSPSSIGTINFATGQKVGTFTFSSALTLNPSDTLTFTFQSTADATFAGAYWNIVGART
jgi:hypothetical protein